MRGLAFFVKKQLQEAASFALPVVGAAGRLLFTPALPAFGTIVEAELPSKRPPRQTSVGVYD